MQSALQYLREILTLIDEDRRKLPILTVLFLGLSLLDLAGLGLIVPFISLVVEPDFLADGHLGKLLQIFGNGTNRETVLLWLSVFLSALFICKAIAALGINNLIIHFAQNQQINLRLRLMQKYQQLPYSIYLQKNSSEYVYSLQTLTTNFQTVLYHSLKTVSDVIVILLILSLLIWENPNELVILIVLSGGILFIYDRLFSKKIKEYGISQNKAAQEIIKGVHEGLEGFKEIRILEKEEYFYNIVKKNAEIVAVNERRNQLTSQAPRYLLETILVIFVVLLVVLSLHWNTPTESLLGTLGLFGVAAIRMMPMASQLSATLTSLRFNRDAVARLHIDLQDHNFTPKRIEQIGLNVDPFNSLRMHGVQFSYPASKQPVLQRLGLEIRASESIGLIGPSGSGKTTLVDVLLGLLKPQSGTIEFNGKPLFENLKQWRSQVAYLPQQIFLIDDTLKHNIALGVLEHEIDDEKLYEAIRQARLSELVEQLPQGENTILGERGVRLSGGQRQRVALARAFYHGRSVLVMDEATSALDNETELEIVEEIRRLKGKKTMIVIAHRLSTVQHCDRIYRLEQGRIVEEGSPQQVLKEAG